MPRFVPEQYFAAPVLDSAERFVSAHKRPTQGAELRAGTGSACTLFLPVAPHRAEQYRSRAHQGWLSPANFFN
jgi:hypothetical protein